MPYNKLAFRNGESMSITTYPPSLGDGNPTPAMTIQVMMVVVPDLPIGDDWNDDCLPYAIVGMDKYEKGWGWIELEGDSKNEIGQYMMDWEAETNVWYYLSIYKLEL